MSRDIALLAVDIDGTLVNGGVMQPADVRALHRAAAAGIRVCLCTGRSWTETKPVWEALALPGPHMPVICVGGAVVVEPGTGRSLYSRPFERAVARDLTNAMLGLGLPAMALVDAWREGFDYYMLGQYDEIPAYRKFFGQQTAAIRRLDHFNGDPFARPLRISILEQPERTEEVLEVLRKQFGGAAELHAICAPNYGVHIVECFASGTTKFSALTYVGQGFRLGSAAIAAIGDDHNDISMLAGVAASAAPADSPPAVLAAAKRTVARRGQCAVAEFVEFLLAAKA